MQKRALPSDEVAMASKLFEKFFQSMEMEDILFYYRDMCKILNIGPGQLSNFYPVLKATVRSACGINLFQVLDKKINSDCFSHQYLCPNLPVVIVGSGPCGLRTAIEAALLGASVTVCEKRTAFTRNNVLHLWPYVIEDLKLLGVKQFFPKFCTGSMNHISIRRLQSVLLKVALVLGVRVYEGVEFVDVVEPPPTGGDEGWRVRVNPNNHPLNKTNVEVLIGAEGKRVTIPGFKRKEFRGKLAIAITANFKNKRTTAEAVVEEISGVAFVYKQDFFNNLYEELGIALENIVYYKDETHYFVMTTKKHSLLDRGVLKKDCKDPIELLSAKNTNKPALLEYIKDACDYCTDYQLPNLDFELNHHGEADVALFDFTSMFAASNSSYVKEKHGKQLLLTLVGDGLLEPFWPTGSGAARGFLGCMDACYMMREWCNGHKSVLEILAERESIFRLLPQTTSENIAKDYKNYTVDPTSRYPNLNKYLYSTQQMAFLYMSDDESKGVVARRDYTPSCNEMRSQVPSFSRPTRATQPQRHRAGSLDYYDDSGSSSGSPQIEHRDLKSRMKALMEAANGDNKADNVEQYMTNRSKLLTQPTAAAAGNKAAAVAAANAAKRDPQAERKAAMEKISKTFGYGENPKQERQTLVSAKERQAEHRKHERAQKLQKQNTMPEISRSKPSSSSSNVQVATKTKSTKAGSKGVGVKQWDFSKATKSKSKASLDDSIDPELDSMLAELETDEDFKKLSDNDQLTWLESLFYLDTPTKMASSKLVKPKPAEELVPRRREKSALSLYSRDQDTDGGVTSKTFAVQGSSKRLSSAAATKQAVQNLTLKSSPPIAVPAPPVPAAVVPATVEDGSFTAPVNREGGLNKDLCSLAATFFNDKPKKPAPQRARVSSTKPSTATQQDTTDRKSLPLPLSSPAAVASRERAFYQPTEEHMVDEEEIPLPTGFQLNQFDSPNLSRREKTSPPQEEGAPPIPIRSGEPKLMMLKLMKNATNALKS